MSLYDLLSARFALADSVSSAPGLGGAFHMRDGRRSSGMKHGRLGEAGEQNVAAEARSVFQRGPSGGLPWFRAAGSERR